jgi:hypothetical protein
MALSKDVHHHVLGLTTRTLTTISVMFAQFANVASKVQLTDTPFVAAGSGRWGDGRRTNVCDGLRLICRGFFRLAITAKAVH